MEIPFSFFIFRAFHWFYHHVGMQFPFDMLTQQTLSLLTGCRCFAFHFYSQPLYILDPPNVLFLTHVLTISHHLFFLCSLNSRPLLMKIHLPGTLVFVSPRSSWLMGKNPRLGLSLPTYSFICLSVSSLNRCWI